MRVNFDANASVKPIPEVQTCLRDYCGQFLNPSSIHHYGQLAKTEIDNAEDAIRQLLKLNSSDKIIFTSGASEANNAAINTSKDFSSLTDLACSSIEHISILEPLRSLESKNKKLIILDPYDLENTDRVLEKLSDQVALLCIMAANNETGQILDVAEISKKVKEKFPRIRIHCDAVQAIGKYQIDFKNLAVDSMSISGHKLGALSGIGALILADGCQLEPWILGGPQGLGFRAGTENMLGIKTLGIACRQAKTRLENKTSITLRAKANFISFITSHYPEAIINKFGKEQLENTISLRLPGIKADDLVVALDLVGVSISAGSACASGKPNASHVLLAHGLNPQEAKETIRISFEANISEEEIDFGISAFKTVLSRFQLSKRAA